MDMKGKRVLLYIRVSTDEQARHGESVLDQTQALHKWAKNHSCIIAGEYHDEGFSARKTYKSRPALSALLEAVERGEGDAVVFTKLDRWFRNLKDYYKVEEVLERYGVFWAAILEDYETKTSAGRFKVNLMLSIAEHEADQTSERIKFTFAQKRERGEIISGQMPRGYILKDGKPVKDPKTQDGVTAFWLAYLDSGSPSAAMDAAARHGVIFKRYNSAAYMINNAGHYAGSIQGVSCEPYITETDRDRVLSEHRRSPRRTNRIYLFRGLIRCGECGGTFGAHQQAYKRKDGQRSAYYTCSRCHQTRKKECSNFKCISEETVEHFLFAEVESAVHQSIVDAELHQEVNRQDNTKQLERLKARLDRLTDAYLDGLIGKDEYRRRRADLDQSITDATPKEEPKRRSPEELRELLPDGWRSMYLSLNVKHKQAFWRRILRKILIYGDNSITFEILC